MKRASGAVWFLVAGLSVLTVTTAGALMTIAVGATPAGSLQRTVAANPRITAAVGSVHAVWKTVLTPASPHSGPTAMTLSADGMRVFVTGYQGGSAGTDSELDYLTVAYDADSGAELWTALYDGPGLNKDVPYAIAASPDGLTVLVTGESVGIGTSADFCTIAYDASTGAVLWTSRFDSPGSNHDTSKAIGVSPDGARVYVTGRSADANNPVSGKDGFVLAYDAHGGALLWTYQIPGTATVLGPNPVSLAVRPDGLDVTVVANYVDPGPPPGYDTRFDYALFDLDAATGIPLDLAAPNALLSVQRRAWKVVYSTSGFIRALAGETASDAGAMPYYVTAGEDLRSGASWAATYQGFNGTPADVVVSPDDSGVFVTGRTIGAPTNHYCTLAYRVSDGSPLWSACGDTIGEAYGIAIAADGATVFVTGTSYQTIAYDHADGAVLWSVAETGTPVGIATRASDGTVFVAGSGCAGSCGYLTVAYRSSLIVRLDIKPGNAKNEIHPLSNAEIPVAILGSDTFDVRTIDRTSLRFGPAGASPSLDLLVSTTYKDALKDVNRDGYLDLVPTFKTSETGIACGDVSAGMTGRTLTGSAWEGSDSIVTRGCKERTVPGAWEMGADGIDTND